MQHLRFGNYSEEPKRGKKQNAKPSMRQMPGSGAHQRQIRAADQADAVVNISSSQLHPHSQGS